MRFAEVVRLVLTLVLLLRLSTNFLLSTMSSLALPVLSLTLLPPVTGSGDVLDSQQALYSRSVSLLDKPSLTGPASGSDASAGGKHLLDNEPAVPRPRYASRSVSTYSSTSTSVTRWDRRTVNLVSVSAMYRRDESLERLVVVNVTTEFF